jgi:hypothetical protein
MPTSSSSSTTNLPLLSPTHNWTELWTASFGIRLSYNYFARTQRTENTLPLLLRACLLGFPRGRYLASPLARCVMNKSISRVSAPKMRE